MNQQIGLQYIAQQQLASGGFMSLSSPAPDTFTAAVSRQTVFLPALIVLALASVPDSTTIINAATQFLSRQRQPNGSFNYWASQEAVAVANSYPSDLDDTSCALAALQLSGQSLDGASWAAVTKLLLATDTAQGGPYQTWLPGSAGLRPAQTVDPVVNSNIAYCLSLQAVNLPPLTSYLETVLDSGQQQSIYYPSDVAFLYSLARWYRGDRQSQLQQCLAQKLSRAKQLPLLEQAQVISSLLRLGYSSPQLTAVVQTIQLAQAVDGSWPAQAYCLDPAQNGHTYYAAAAAYTTACCLEALALYRAATAPQVSQQFTKSVITHLPAEVVLRQQVRSLQQRNAQLPQAQTLHLLPALIAMAWQLPIPRKLAQQLQRISTLGWMAYSGIDDYLDNDPAAAHLPAAVWCLRRLHIELTATLPTSDSFQNFWQACLNAQDAANAWELAHCRPRLVANRLQLSDLPDYGNLQQLANRSAGIYIAPLAVLVAAGISRRDRRFRALQQFFQHYLIGRQLNDDAHDWFDDLEHGHVNAVAAQLLRDWQATRPMATTIQIHRAKRQLQRLFWEQTSYWWQQQVQQQLAAARQQLETIGIPAAAQLQPLLQPLQTALDELQLQRQQSLDFIQAL